MERGTVLGVCALFVGDWWNTAAAAPAAVARTTSTPAAPAYYNNNSCSSTCINFLEYIKSGLIPPHHTVTRRGKRDTAGVIKLQQRNHFSLTRRHHQDGRAVLLSCVSVEGGLAEAWDLALGAYNRRSHSYCQLSYNLDREITWVVGNPCLSQQLQALRKILRQTGHLKRRLRRFEWRHRGLGPMPVLPQSRPLALNTSHDIVGRTTRRRWSTPSTGIFVSLTSSCLTISRTGECPYWIR